MELLSTIQTTVFSSRGLCRWLLLSGFTLSCLSASAQNPDPLQFLVFEPVLLAVEKSEDTAGDAQPAYLARELTTLPRANAVDLQAWLSARQSTAPPTPETLAEDIARYEKVIVDLELAGGPYEPRLDQELLALANLLQQTGDYNRAQEILDRASHVNRVNNGLFNLSQLPIIDETIENHLARGDLVAADAQQEYLMYVQRKNLGDNSVDLLPALTRYAEWNVFAFSARMLPTSALAIEGDGTDREQPSATTLERFRADRLLNAQNIYQTIIQIMTNNFGVADRRLLDVERQLALTNYFFATTFVMSSTDPGLSASMGYTSNLLPYELPAGGANSLGYRQGRQALERRVEYMGNMNDISPTDLAQAKIELGDWLLTFNKRMGALDVYDGVYQELLAAEVPQARIDALLSPSLPREIPEFLQHGYSRKALELPADLALEYKGYIDVEFTLNRYGACGPVKVLGKAPTATPDIESRLLRNLRRSQFRPRYDNGKVRETDLVQLRYYYTY
jgi:hypothetical protein